MRVYILVLSMLFSSRLFAQSPVYQQTDVDSVAVPRGGMPFFNTFVQATLRKPMQAQALGTVGRVIVSGVVEPNGTITDVKVLVSARPELAEEAKRVFTLFNAWQPAQKNGQAVRQQITMPVTFLPNTPFSYVNGTRVTYYESDGKATADSTQAHYKQIAPVDERGIPTGDVVVYEQKGKNWKKDFTMPLVRQTNTGFGKEKTYTVGNQTHEREWQGDVFLISDSGKIIRQTAYQNGKQNGISYRFYPTGAVAEKKEENEGASNSVEWYANGQIKQIKSIDKLKAAILSHTAEQVTAVWDSTGVQTVKFGEGHVTYQKWVASKSDTNKSTLFTEIGTYQNTFKHGLWKGQYADGSFYYEERYDNGIFRGGKSKTGKQDTLQYTFIEQMPEFPGSLPGLSKFLSDNLSYPVSAQKAGVQGQVFVSFVVCTDGTLCDYEIVKSAHPDLDREALRVVKKMSGKWKPAVQRGEKVRVKYNLPINFSLH